MKLVTCLLQVSWILAAFVACKEENVFPTFLDALDPEDQSYHFSADIEFAVSDVDVSIE